MRQLTVAAALVALLLGAFAVGRWSVDGSPTAQREDERPSEEPTAKESTPEEPQPEDPPRRRVIVAVIGGPPADMPHLESTPSTLRVWIDEQIEVLCAPDAGGDSRFAREGLIAVGKPAFPRILAKAASLRERLSAKEPKTVEEQTLQNQLLTAIGRCDLVLREMDGYLNFKSVMEIKPGNTRRFVRYVLGLHYKRWVMTLAEMDEMPGSLSR